MSSTIMRHAAIAISLPLSYIVHNLLLIIHAHDSLFHHAGFEDLAGTRRGQILHHIPMGIND